MLSLHAEAGPELNGNSEGDVTCVFSFTAALFGARLAPSTYPQTSLVTACSCDYQVPFCNTGRATALSPADHSSPGREPLFLDPQCYPHCIAAAVQKGFFLASRQLSAIITFSLIALGPPSERDRQGQVGRVPKPLPASRRAKRILVPAAVAAAENVRGGLAQARPSGFFIPARSVMASSVPTPATGFHVEQKRV